MFVLFRSLSRFSKSRILGIAVLIAALLGLADYVTGPLFSLTVFYLFPVALVAWVVGRRQAIFISLLCAVIWTAADFETFTTGLPLPLDLWNCVVRIAFFVIVSYTLTTARRALDRESRLAREIQQALLPVSLPRLEGIDIATAYRPATVLSGDYFDVLPVGDGGLVLCVADVAGKGAGPALLMASLQAAVRLLAPTGRSPAGLCEALNVFVADRGIPSRFITFFVCRIDLDRMRLSYSNAGHNPPIVLRKDGSRIRLSEGGLVLGVFERPYAQAEVSLLPGDTLVLYTDGLTEARDRRGREFGEQRLIDVLARGGRSSPDGLQARLMEELKRFSRGVFDDDVTLLVLSVREDARGAAASPRLSDARAWQIHGE